MKGRKFSIIIAAIITAGCSAGVLETAPAATWSPEPPLTSPTPRIVPTNANSSEPSNLFTSRYCPLSLIPGDGWSIQEYEPGEPGSFSSDAASIVLLKDQYLLVLMCAAAHDETPFSVCGMPAGENVNLPEIDILGMRVPGQAIVQEGAMKTVLYRYHDEFVNIFVRLDAHPDPSTPIPYESFEIPPGIIAEVAAILNTLSLTGNIEARASDVRCCSPQIMLPMVENYHSQIEATDFSNACAPTAGFIVLDYLLQETSIDDVIDLLRSVPPERGGYDPACQRNVVCTSPMVLAQQLSQRYRLTSHTSQGWTFDAVYDALALGHPIIADILWRIGGSGLGHFVVIYGIDWEEELIYYHDPLEGESMVASWQQFSERWAGPVDVGDPTFSQGYQFWGMEIFPESLQEDLSS